MQKSMICSGTVSSFCGSSCKGSRPRLLPRSMFRRLPLHSSKIYPFSLNWLGEKRQNGIRPQEPAKAIAESGFELSLTLCIEQRVLLPPDLRRNRTQDERLTNPVKKSENHYI